MKQGKLFSLDTMLTHRVQACTSLKEYKEVFSESDDFPQVHALALKGVEEILMFDLSLAENVDDCVTVRDHAYDISPNVKQRAQIKIDDILRTELEKATTLGGCYLPQDRKGSYFFAHDAERKRQAILQGQIEAVSTLTEFRHLQSDINTVGDYETKQKASNKLESLFCGLIHDTETVAQYLYVLSILPSDSKHNAEVKKCINALLREKLDAATSPEDCLRVHGEAPKWSNIAGEAWRKHLEIFKSMVDEVKTTKECFNLYCKIPRFYDVERNASAKLCDFIRADLAVAGNIAECRELRQYVEDPSPLLNRIRQKEIRFRREELWVVLRKATSPEDCWRVFVDDASNKKIKRRTREKYSRLLV